MIRQNRSGNDGAATVVRLSGRFIATGEHGLTLMEVLMTIVVVSILTVIGFSAMRGVRDRSNEAKSASNIRQLATANIAYAADHGRYVRDANDGNNRRWFGSRSTAGATGSQGDDYGGTGGYLSDYLDGGKVRYCPVFLDMVETDPNVASSSQFEKGAGGYGYNSAYIGNTPDMRYAGSTGTGGLTGKRPKPGEGQESNIVSSPGNYAHNVGDAARTVMFTSSAIVYGSALAETGESAPPKMILPSGLGGSMTPTTHFRFRGRALVAWADGHVTFEAPNDGDTSWSVYGGDNGKYRLGWFGPTEYNGYWNPRYADRVPY